MRLHDRRALLAALVILAAYCALVGAVILLIAGIFGIAPPHDPSPLMHLGLTVTGWLMGWRLLSRACWTSHVYGWRQGLLSIPRTFVANVITIAAMRRAIRLYRDQLRSGTILWEKTHHRFPAQSHEADAVAA
ncbi:MAG: hypothetical protein B7Z20_10025, partial [Sphingobium sp. 32-64-5]